jgi:tetratricopeptide (TPR) repeat protein
MIPRLCALAIGLCALGTGELSAQESADALIDRGVALREEGRDEEALAVFRQAWERDPTPRGLAQMALAEQALGRWVDAERHLVEALGRRRDGWIRSVRSVLEQALAEVREHVGQLEIRTNVDGAVLHVGGRAVATLPSEPLSLPAGEAHVRVEAPGHRAAHRTVRIAPGELTREWIELAEARDAPHGVEPDGASGDTLRIVAFAGAGVAAAGAIGAAIWWAGRQAELDDCREGGCANEDDLAGTRDLAAAVTITAALLAAGGLILGIVLAGDGDEPGRGAAPLACSASPLALSCAARF